MPEVSTQKRDELTETIVQGIEKVQKSLNKQGDRIDALETDKVEKITKSVTDAVEELTQLSLKAKAQEKKALEQEETIKNLELQMARGGNGEKVEELKEYTVAHNTYLRKGTPIPDELNDQACSLLAEEIVHGEKGVHFNNMKTTLKDLTAAEGPNGGYFIQPQRSSKIIDRIFETSPLRGLANQETTTSDTFEYIIDDDETDSGWVGEVAARPDTNTPQVKLLKIPVHEIYARPKATQKMLDNAGFNIEAWLQKKLASEFSRKENTSFVTGDGSQKPQGFLTYPDGDETYKVEQISSGTSGDFDGDSFISLQNALLEEYQTTAVWGMKRATFSNVMKLKDDYGQYLLNPRMMFESAEKIILGSPVVFMNDMETMAADSLSVVYADWSEFYTIIDRMGLRVLRDPYTLPPYVRFYTTKAVGGSVTNFQAGKIMKLSE